MSKKIDELANFIEESKKEVSSKGRVALQEAFLELFNKHEDLLAIQWVGYIPYFNDGEACEFKVGSPYIKLKSLVKENPNVDETDRVWDNPQWECCYLHHYVDYPALEIEVVGLFDIISKDLMETVFGSHHKVTVTRDSMEVEEYMDHE